MWGMSPSSVTFLLLVRSLVIVGCCAGGRVFSEIISLPLLSIWRVPGAIARLGGCGPLLWRSCLAGFQVCSCRLGVFISLDGVGSGPSYIAILSPAPVEV